jgi:pimeloyl-ACP methyl ester carboxylesterase
MKAFQANSAAANILYHDIPGSSTPLVFIHGLGCASSCDYLRVATDSAISGRRAILVDLLGSGFSERPVGFSYSVHDHARSVAELIRHVCSGPISLFGHSMGGAVAVVLASILGAQVENLVLSEPNLDPGGGTFSRKIAAMPEAEFVAYGHHEMVETAKAEGNVVWAASLAASAGFAVHRAAVSLVEGSAPTWRELLYGSKVPKTIIVGEHSLPYADLDGLRRHGIGLGIVPAAGHSLALENPPGLAIALSRALF